MPRPETFDAKLLPSHITGNEAVESLENINALLSAKSCIAYPYYYNPVTLLEQFGYPPEDAAIPIGMKYAVLLRGDSFTAFLDVMNRVMEKTPYKGEPVDEATALLREAFGVYVMLDPQTEVTTISNVSGTDHHIRIQRDPNQPVFSGNIQDAVAALAVAPDILWKAIRKGGLVIGELEGDFYDEPWNVRSHEFFIEDPDGILQPDGPTRYWLSPFHPRIVFSQGLSEEKIAFLKSRETVGILADVRVAEK